MNQSQIHNAIGELPEELIAPVAKLRQKKRYPVLKWVAAAACLCLLLSQPLVRNDFLSVKSESTNDGLKLEAPQENVLADENASVHTSVFRARVLKVYDNGCILVEPLEGEAERSSGDSFEVSFPNLQQVPEIKAGDTVIITYDGMIQELYPCRLPGVYDIEVAE